MRDETEVDPSDIDDDEPPPVPTRFWATSAVVIVVTAHLAGFGQVSAPIPGPRLAIDPDSAPLSLLATLPHIGQSLLNAIESARSESPIRSEQDLDRIPGVGPRTLDDLRPYLTFSSAPRSDSESEAVPFAPAGQ